MSRQCSDSTTVAAAAAATTTTAAATAASTTAASLCMHRQQRVTCGNATLQISDMLRYNTRASISHAIAVQHLCSNSSTICQQQLRTGCTFLCANILIIAQCINQ